MRANRLLPMAALVLVAVSACGGGSAASPATGPLLVDVFYAFSGPNAGYGPEAAAGCFPAARLINASGGVLGHQVTCRDTDNKGDPADSVPLANQLIASNPNLVVLLGGDGDTATALVPIFNQASIPIFATTGQASFDKATQPFFWRDVPPDEAQGYGMALAAQKLGYSRVALVFGNDVAAQGTAPTARKGARKLGLNIVVDQTIALNQPSYRTEVEQLIAAHPQAIISEADPQTTGTYMSELKQLGGTPPPIVGDQLALDPTWRQTVVHAVGTSTFDKLVFPVVAYAPPDSAGSKTWVTALMASSASVPNTSSWTTDLYSAADYDSVIISALAMLESNSTSPATFNKYISRVTNPSPGATVVHTYAEGKAALAAGKKIQYVGASGEIVFNQFHNSTFEYEIEQEDAAGNVTLVGPVTGKAIQALSG